MPLSTRLFSTEKAPESHLPSKSINLYIPLSGPIPGALQPDGWDNDGSQGHPGPL